MATVKSISPGSAFKVGLVTYGILGLIFGLIWAFFAMVAGSLGSLASQAGGATRVLGFGLGIGAIIIFPILYGLIGGIFAAIGALIYNLAASWVGGLEVDIG